MPLGVGVGRTVKWTRIGVRLPGQVLELAGQRVRADAEGAPRTSPCCRRRREPAALAPSMVALAMPAAASLAHDRE